MAQYTHVSWVWFPEILYKWTPTICCQQSEQVTVCWLHAGLKDLNHRLRTKFAMGQSKLCLWLTNIMNEALNLVLHAPVFELHSAQFVSSHHWLISPFASLVVLTPAILQRASARLGWAEQPGVLLLLVVPAADGVLHNVHDVCTQQQQKHQSYRQLYSCRTAVSDVYGCPHWHCVTDISKEHAFTSPCNACLLPMILVTDGVLYIVISISKIAAAAAKSTAMMLSALMSHNINKFSLCSRCNIHTKTNTVTKMKACWVLFHIDTETSARDKAMTHQLPAEPIPTFLSWRCCPPHSSHYSIGFQSPAGTSPRRGSGSASWCMGKHSMLLPLPAVLTWAKWPETTLKTGRTVGNQPPLLFIYFVIYDQKHVIFLCHKCDRLGWKSHKVWWIKQFLWKHRWLFTQTAIACWWAHNDSFYLYFVSNKCLFKPRFNN